jgi:hypothetical protein
MPSSRAVGLAMLLAGSVVLAPASEAASVTADGGGFSSADGNVTKHPFDVTYVDDTATDGSKSVTGNGYIQEATLTDPPIIDAYAGGNGSAYAAPGRLRAVAGGHAYSTTGINFLPRVTANFGASFSDAIHLNSVGLAAGTPVTYRVRIEISAEQSGAYYYSGFGYPTGTFYFSYAIGGYGTYYSFPVSGFSNLPDLHFQIPFELTGSVGDVVTVTGTLGVGTDDRANGGYGYDQQTNLDASDGVTFYIEPVTPGLTISSDSGHSYSAPEPGPELLGAMSALTMLGLVARRRHRAIQCNAASA